MHVTILAYGSRGDVQPYVALGAGFRRAGHSVRLAAPRMFGSFVTEHGLEFSPLAGNPAQLVIQAVAVAIVIVFAFGVTYLVARVLNRLVGLRVTQNEEEVGLDISEHGERAYA